MATYSTNIDAPSAPRAAPRHSRRAGARAIVALFVALASALFASLLITRALQHRPKEVVSVPVRRVVVAKAELPAATTLTADMLRVIDWPAPSVPDGTVEEPDKVVGRVLKTAVVPGDAIVEARLAPASGGAGLAAMIPANMRAMTVKVNEASGVAGFIHPGDLVDVIATMPPDERSTAPRSHIVLQNIRVLAVGQEIAAGGLKPIPVPVVTLLVGPSESERLALASTHGELQLTMRSGSDTGAVPTPGISPPELFALVAEPEGDEAEAAPAACEPLRPRRPRPWLAFNRASKRVTQDDVIEIIRGTTSEQRRLKTTRTDPAEVRK